MSPPDLSVIVLNYNAAAYVRTCLASLAEGCAGLNVETIVVDNASPLPGIEQVVLDFPGVRLLRRRRNGGFSAGINTGLRVATAEAALILNPDTRVGPHAAAAMLDHLRANPDIGVIGPRILNEDGSLQLSCRRFPTLHTALFNRYSLLTRLAPTNRYSAGYLMSDWNHDRIADVDWLSGAAMLLRRSALERVGLFDEGYFFAIEDVDLCRRMHLAGLRVVYLPEAEVVHRIGASSSTAAMRVIVARHTGMWRYYRRYMRAGPVVDGLAAAAISGRCAAQIALTGSRRLLSRP